MGQLESKLDHCERSDLLLSPNSRKMAATPNDSSDAASPSQSPPSSPAASRGTLSPGDLVSNPKRYPSRSLLSFWHTSEKRLIEAAKRGDDEEISVLLTDGIYVNTRTTIKKETPLHKAAQYGNVSTALLLLLNGADPCALGNVFLRLHARRA